MMSAKLATPDFLKIQIFRNKGYNVIISDYDVTNKILLCDSNYIVAAVMWRKFGNSSISMRDVIKTAILSKKIWAKKTLFLRGGLGSNSIIWGWN